MQKNNRGFSLIEVLAIVVIIALLAAITVPTYQMNTTQARLATLIPLMDGLMHEVLISYGVTGAPPATLDNVAGSGTGSYGPFVVENNEYFLHYVNGSGWANVGALIQLSVPSSIGQAISGFIPTTTGQDGADNSIAMAFYDDQGTIVMFCGRWDSSNNIYIPPTYLPPGCTNDNFIGTVTGTS